MARASLDQAILELNTRFHSIKLAIEKLPIDPKAKEKALEILRSHVDTAIEALRSVDSDRGINGRNIS